MSTATTPPLLELSGLHKVFPNGTVALDGVDLTVTSGSVHGLVGANGAGKSTLIKILSGAHQATAGEIRWRGREQSWRTPRDARDVGIATLYQHVPVSPTLTVLENVFLGHGGWRRSSREQRRTFDALTERIGYWVAPDRVVSDLSIGERQMVTLLQALAIGADLVVMDEPTASLSQSERDVVFDVVRRLSADGTTFLYVSHFLDEVLDLTDHITVLRDGQVSASASTSELSEDELVTAIVGRELLAVERRHPSPPRTGAPVLRVEGMTIPGQVHGVDLALAAGEVVGVAGLLGSGRTELLTGIFGVEPRARGQVVVDEEPVGRSTTAAVRAGMALVPEDRSQQGLVGVLDLQANVTLPHLTDYSRGRMLPDAGRERARAMQAIADLGILAPGPDAAVTELSGGNAQKVVFARWLHPNVRVLLLDEPTAGVDVGAKADILELIRSFAAEGRAVLMVSSEFEELLAVCQRVLVLHKGRVIAERDSADTSEEALLALASGIEEDQENHHVA